MPIQHRPTLAEIDLDCLRHNTREILQKIPSHLQCVAVVKANAYGHGALFCVRTLKKMGITRFAVATLEEGIELRQGGIQDEIFILNGLLTEDLHELQEFRLKPIIHQLEDIKRLGIYTKEHGKEIDVHLKLDTGMGRLGFLPSHTGTVIQYLQEFPKIKVSGLFTHLARADEEDPTPTLNQFNTFKELKKQYAERGITAPLFHIANSAAIIDGRLDESTWVRPGLMLYGAYPHPRQQPTIHLRPLMTLKTKIMNIKTHPPETPLSYGGTFITKRHSLIAILPIGYADGYPRLVSNRGHVLVKGKQAPVVGRVCMDLTLIDVTDIPDVSLNDEVILMGTQGDLSIRAEEIAEWAETISYEIFCGISNRVPRIYKGL